MARPKKQELDPFDYSKVSHPKYAPPATNGAHRFHMYRNIATKRMCIRWNDQIWMNPTISVSVTDIWTATHDDPKLTDLVCGNAKRVYEYLGVVRVS